MRYSGLSEDRESTVTGLLTGQATINGRGADWLHWREGGTLGADGVLWQAPVFGIFSQVLGQYEGHPRPCLVCYYQSSRPHG